MSKTWPLELEWCVMPSPLADRTEGFAATVKAVTLAGLPRTPSEVGTIMIRESIVPSRDSYYDQLRERGFQSYGIELR